MSRRSVLMLVATVVLLYFSIILFMLNPLHGAKGVYYGNNYLNRFGFRQIPALTWCKELKWRTPPSPNVVALVSYPGSGNTWLRYLIQQATGIVTGSIYMDYGLRVHGFPAENVTDGSVIVVKTHEAPPAEIDRFKSAILLIRNPRDAILADFNRLHKGHVGTAPKSAFKRKSPEHRKTDWANYVSVQLMIWETLHKLWLTTFPGALHVLSYEALVEDTRSSLNDLLKFLNHTVSEEDMNCALANKEGIYRRRKKHQDFDPFTSDMYKTIDVVRVRVSNMIVDYKRRHSDGNKET